MSLSDFPRVPLLFGPSPIHPLPRLSEALGNPRSDAPPTRRIRPSSSRVDVWYERSRTMRLAISDHVIVDKKGL